MQEILNHFGENVTELLSREPALEMEKRNHVALQTVVDLDEKRDDTSLENVLNILREQGYEHYFTLPTLYFLDDMDRSTFVLCTNGAREFEDSWTSFRCRNEGVVVFAFRNVQDAILVKLHT